MLVPLELLELVEVDGRARLVEQAPASTSFQEVSMPRTLPVRIEHRGDGVLTLTGPRSGVLKLNRRETLHEFPPEALRAFLRGGAPLHLLVHGDRYVVRSYIRGA